MVNTTYELNIERGIIVDEDDEDLLHEYLWHIGSHGYPQRNTTRSEKRAGMSAMELLHRRVMVADEDQEIDHVNRNKLDARKSNLRFVSRKRNMRNVPSATRMGLAGDSRSNKVRASITVGTFDTYEEGEAFCNEILSILDAAGYVFPYEREDY